MIKDTSLMKSMVKTAHRLWILMLCSLILPALSFAGPIISCDSQNVNIGSIREGTIKRIRHVFTIKNTGDAPLKIIRVKPG